MAKLDEKKEKIKKISEINRGVSCKKVFVNPG